MSYKLGLDTGGTYTDAVLLDEKQQVVAHAKSPTTHHDLSIGLRSAVSALLDASRELSRTDSAVTADIQLVSMSTTLATNAIVEGRGRPVCLVLIGYSERQFKRARLGDALGGDPLIYIDGGHNASGAPLADFDLQTLQSQIDLHSEGVEAFAVSGMFSVRNPEHEIAARDCIRDATRLPVSCGHQLSTGLDAPKRALTTLLNARLIPLIKDLLVVTESMLTDFGIAAPLMVVKGDGSLISAEFATDSPVETILSGPAASVVGAQFVSGEKNLVISDMGGTTTDIAILKQGRPQLDQNGATVGGWATMVEAVRINTSGLGGDSAVSFDREQRTFTIGPQRVIPLASFISQYPQLQATLDEQLKLPFSTTHSAQFVVINRTAATSSPGQQENAPGQNTRENSRKNTRLTSQQNELLERIQQSPMALQTLFEDQTLDRALQSLLKRGHILLAGFTPTDACLVIDEHFQVAGSTAEESGVAWDRKAAAAGARLLMRYSEQNLGPVWQQEIDFAQWVKRKVERLAALAILDTVFSDQRRQLRHQHSHPHPHPGGLQGNTLTTQQRQLLDELFVPEPAGARQLDTPPEGSSPAVHAESSDLSVDLKVRLNQPVIGIGAPAQSYYPGVATLLGTSAIVPELAGVTNALGAVVGTVEQSCAITITAAGGKRVVAHTSRGPEEYPTLEEAADVMIAELEQLAIAKSRQAGAENVETRVQRKDVVVEDQGESVFFESVITVTASGRPATMARE